MSDADLNAIRERVEALRARMGTDWVNEGIAVSDVTDLSWFAMKLPALLTLCEAQQARITALRFYADEDHYLLHPNGKGDYQTSPVDVDGGDIARKALEDTP